MLSCEETPGKGPGDSRGFEGFRSHPNLISEPHPYPQSEEIHGYLENGSSPDQWLKAQGQFHMISA